MSIYIHGVLTISLMTFLCVKMHITFIGMHGRICIGQFGQEGTRILAQRMKVKSVNANGNRLEINVSANCMLFQAGRFHDGRRQQEPEGPR